MGLIPVFVCCFGLKFNRNSYIYGFGTHSVFVYCSGLNSAIFTEWDSFQYLYTALVLNSTVIAIFMDLGLNSVFVYCSGLNSAIFTEWDSFQYSCTALVLNSVIFSLLGLNPVFVYCSDLNSAIFTEWDSFQYPCTVLVLFQLYLLFGTQFSTLALN